jgi:hypothetical protein
MSARLRDDDATAVLDAAGAPMLYALVVFLILGSLVLAGGLL